MRKIIIAAIIAVFTGIWLWFFMGPNTSLRAGIMRALDKDTIYLKNGTAVKGFIIGEDDNHIWIQKKGAQFTIERSRCEEVKKDKLKNTFLRYIKELI